MAIVDLSTAPWLIRFLDRVPLPLPLMAISIALAHFLFMSILRFALSPTLEGEYLYWWYGTGFLGLGSDIVLSMIVGYMATAGYYGLREAVRDFLSLRPALSCDDIEFDHLLSRLQRVPRVPLYIAGVLALVMGFSLPLTPDYWADPPRLWSTEMTLVQIKECLVIFFTARTIALEFISAGLFSSVAQQFVRIELLDPERVAPFSRRALRGVLVFVLYMAIVSLLIPSVGVIATTIGAVIGASLLAAAVFLIPLIPLQRKIHAAKQSELARLRADIRRENEARNPGDEDWTRLAGLAGLIAYEQRIEKVSTWAFNTPTVVRFLLYVSLGIGSWLGAAFVERWLGTLLGS